MYQKFAFWRVYGTDNKLDIHPTELISMTQNLFNVKPKK